MEKLHHLGLLFLNFGVLNILLSVIFLLISVTGKRFISSPHIKSRLFFLSLVAPPALSAFAILTSFAPPLFIKIPGKAMLCLNEPYCYLFSLVSPDKIPLFDGLLISSVVLVLLPVIYSLIGMGSYLRASKTLVESSGAISQIRNDVLKEVKEVEHRYKLRVTIIETPCLLSFIWGYISNTLILSTGALKALSIEELRGLLAHELSRYRRRDNILKGILLLCRNSLFIFPHVYYIFRWWKEEIELIGDETAALSTGRPLDVASALLKMVTPSSQENPPLLPFMKGGMGDWPYAIGFSIAQNDHLFTDRVERLVAINDGKIRPGNEIWHRMPSETGLLVSMASLFLISFIAIAEFKPLLVHCYLEKLFSLF